MHPQPLEFFSRVRKTRPLAGFTGDVFEGGSLWMNGSAMDDVFADATSHFGVDWRAGRNVSAVSVLHEYETEERFDTVLMTEVSEHDPHWRQSLAKLVEVLKPGGNLWFSCAARARPVHEKHVGINEWYQGLDLVDVLSELRTLADFDEIVCAQNVAPADTYIAALGKRTERRPCAVSVVIPSCQARFLPRCLRTHRELSSGISEFVVVMNGSAREDEDAILSSPDFPDLVALYDVNLGFPGACNAGLRIRNPEAKVVCLVNDDTEATILGWDERVSKILADKPKIGALSPVVNFIASPYQRHGIVPTPELYGVPVLFFTWVAFPVEALESVGNLDERFGLGNYEDVDLSFRLIDAGFELVVDPVHVVYHRGHGTFGLMPPGQFEAVMKASEAVLRTKYGARFQLIK